MLFDLPSGPTAQSARTRRSINRSGTLVRVFAYDAHKEPAISATAIAFIFQIGGDPAWACRARPSWFAITMSDFPNGGLFESIQLTKTRRGFRLVAVKSRSDSGFFGILEANIKWSNAGNT